VDLRKRLERFFSRNQFGEFRTGELAEMLDLHRRDQRALRSALTSLVDEGLLVRRRGGWYRSAGRQTSSGKEGTGVFRRTAAGYGFVETKDGLRDIFVAPTMTAGAMDGDLVKIRAWGDANRREGSVSEVVERHRDRVVGTSIRDGSTWFLELDNPRVASRLRLEAGADMEAGMAVVARVTEFPTSDHSGVAKPERILGRSGDVEVEVAKILIHAGVDDAFPQEVIDQAQQAADESVSVADDRRDLRDLDWVTIDPADAKDFDDALYAERLDDGGFRLYVAIADVAHYVRPGTDLDREARRRGFSLYLPHRAIPMLPESLSSGSCSLNPNVDRAAMSVSVDISAKGKVLDQWYGQAVIRSSARLDYGLVGRILKGEVAARKEVPPHIVDLVLLLDELSRTLLKRRRRRGYLELETAEPKVLLEDGMRVVDVVASKADRGVKRAYSLVEHCMLEANEAVGRLMAERGVSVPWRVHPAPDPDRLPRLADVLRRLGLDVPPELEGGAPGTRTLARVAKELAAHPDGDIFSIYLLQTLSQAAYSTENVGHYALACGMYLHFTSPIRRYADVLVHRRLKAVLSVESDRASMPDDEELEELSGTLSRIERTYVDAEREGVNLFRALLMQDRIGAFLEARVSGVMSFGAFVVTRSPFVEGLLRTVDLGGDRWELDDTGLALVQQGSGRRLAIGDPIDVVVQDVSIVRRQILMVPAGELTELPSAKPRRSHRDSRGNHGRPGGRRRR